MVARVEWKTADAGTGRNVSTAHDTVAKRLRVAKKTIQRARGAIQELGYSATVAAGGYLTREQRQEAHLAHGGRQLRAASVRALTVPVPSPVSNVHLPVSRRENRYRTVLKSPPTRAKARSTAATRPQPRQQQAKTAPRTKSPRSPRPLELQKLAGQLATRYPWVAQNVHIGALCDLLDRQGITPDRYTAATLPRELDQALAKHNITTASPAQQKRPLGYFAWMLSLLDTTTLETEHERLIRTHNEAIERTRQQAAEREATRARMAKVDQDEVARIIAAMKADAAMSHRLGRYPGAGTF